jgi:hypothetical protein
VYADSRITINLATRCAAAIGFVLPRDSVIAGRSAARLHGADVTFDGVEALVPPAAVIAPHDGIVVHRGQLAREDRLERKHFAVTHARAYVLGRGPLAARGRGCRDHRPTALDGGW